METLQPFNVSYASIRCFIVTKSKGSFIYVYFCYFTFLLSVFLNLFGPHQSFVLKTDSDGRDGICRSSLTLRRLMSYIYMEHPFLMFLDHTRLSTVGRTPLDEWSARRRDLYLTTHDTHNRQISMPPVGFEPKISAGERPEADLEASRMGAPYIYDISRLKVKAHCSLLKTCMKLWQVF